MSDFLKKLVAYCTSSNLTYSVDVPSSSDNKAIRLHTTVASPAGVCICSTLYWEINRCAHLYVIGVRQWQLIWVRSLWSDTRWRNRLTILELS